jgi:hypothetical protein
LPVVPAADPPNWEEPVPFNDVAPPAVPFGLFEPERWLMWWCDLCPEWVSAKLLESANAVASAIVVNHGRFLWGK